MLAGSARIEERLALTVEPVGGVDFQPQWGLNEIMVEKHARHRLVRLAVEVDGAYVTTFSADGVIVASPTGSTAYSFSARGPIVSPAVDSLVLTPIAAHMVFDRSFVLGPGSQVHLDVVGEESGVLSADGRRSISSRSVPRCGSGRPPAQPGPPRRRARVPLAGSEKFGLPGEPGERPGEPEGDDGVGTGG